MIDHVAYIILVHAAGASLTPEDAVSVLNVLPHHEPVLAAVLSRGFNEFGPFIAIRDGHGLALLPHYPVHCIMDDLLWTLRVASSRGHLPTIKLLWKRVGPTSPGRLVWFINNLSGFLNMAIRKGNTVVLDWVVAAAGKDGILIDWESRPWDCSAAAGHTKCIFWGISHGYLRTLDCVSALRSTCKGETKIVDWWIVSQQHALAQLKDVAVLVSATKYGTVKTLDWWWAYSGSKLPELTAFVEIVDAALAGDRLEAVEWWWMRFLECRTPEHTFGTLREVGQFTNRAILDWYWQRFCDQHGSPPGLIFTIAQQTTMPILQWAVEKCTKLSGQKLVLMDRVASRLAYQGKVAMLEYVFLNSKDVLSAEWPTDLVSQAIQQGQCTVLEWLELHQNDLPPQNLDCTLDLKDAAMNDTAEVLEWWHARGFPTTKRDWQQACIDAITCNAYCVQLWFRKHPDLYAPESETDRQQFIDKCLSGPRKVSPFTLDFLATIVPVLDLDPSLQLPEGAYVCPTLVLWWCARNNLSTASLLPLNPSCFKPILKSRNNTPVLEWWLQAYLAAGHSLLLPAADDVDYHCQHDKFLRLWVHDVIITRKIAVFVQYWGDVMLYKPPLML